jgi:hypothetical protein
MFRCRNYRSNSASQGQPSAITETRARCWRAALAFILAACILAVSASIIIAQGEVESAVPVQSPSHSHQKRLWPAAVARLSPSIQHWQINGDQAASLPGIRNDTFVAKGDDYDKWSTARLSVARYGLAATSLPSQGLALFAGGVGATLKASTQLVKMCQHAHV